LIKNDFAWASSHRDSILTEWRKRYDGKSEKQ
jgi:iron(III) transport system substrate-binding protein